MGHPVLSLIFYNSRSFTRFARCTILFLAFNIQLYANGLFYTSDTENEQWIIEGVMTWENLFRSIYAAILGVPVKIIFTLLLRRTPLWTAKNKSEYEKLKKWNKRVNYVIYTFIYLTWAWLALGIVILAISFSAEGGTQWTAMFAICFVNSILVVQTLTAAVLAVIKLWKFKRYLASFNVL